MLKKTDARSFEFVYGHRKTIERKFKELLDGNSTILKAYNEGIQNLKKYELHPAFKKEGKSYLSDIYYDE